MININRKSLWLIWLSAPAALLYGLVVWVRNVWFDFRWKKGLDNPPLHVITVGNLSAGGTGKTPFVNHLLNKHDKRCTAVLSRGYGRKTKGYVVVHTDDVPERVGDEPLMIKRKHPVVVVVVCENRQRGLSRIAQQFPHIKHVILDDAFQHRWVKPHKSYLLTTWHHPFYRDHLLPFGDLREWRSGAKRASTIIVTKCPVTLTTEQKVSARKAIKQYSTAEIHFFSIRYGRWHCVYGSASNMQQPLVVTGIADPKPIYNHLKNQTIEYYARAFADHAFFSQNDIDEMLRTQPNCILTTEKDWTRMARFDWKGTSVFVLPMEIIELT